MGQYEEHHQMNGPRGRGRGILWGESPVTERWGAAQVAVLPEDNGAMRSRAAANDGQVSSEGPVAWARSSYRAGQTRSYWDLAQKGTMAAFKIVAVLLIASGIIGLMYGGITSTKTTHDAEISPAELSITDKRAINVPIWAGVAAIVVGGGLMLVRVKA